MELDDSKLLQVEKERIRYFGKNDGNILKTKRVGYLNAKSRSERRKKI